MSENGNEVEVAETEIETMPEAGGLVSINTKEQVQDLIAFAENIDQVIAAHNKIRLAILKLTQPSDWTIFNKFAEIGFAPANRIGATLGISYINWTAEKITGMDEKGNWYRWEYQADAMFRNRTVRVYGRAGSRDKFFGKKDGEYKELHDIDEGNIKMAAMRACKKEGVKDLFGLHHLDPEYLKKYGINLSSAGGYDFKSKDQKADEILTAVITVKEIRKKEGENNGKKWTKYAVCGEKGEVFGTFSETIANSAHGMKGKPATINYEMKGEYKTIVSIAEGNVGEVES